jgi:hypothetical protein
MELLELNQKKSKLLFKNEVQNLEFNELIGNMDISAYTNPKIREKYLLEIGKKLLARKINLRKRIIYEIKKLFDRIYYWYLLYPINRKKRKRDTTDNSLSDSQEDINFKVYSQEEIDKLLTAVGDTGDKKTETLSQEEINELLDAINNG